MCEFNTETGPFGNANVETLKLSHADEMKLYR